MNERRDSEESEKDFLLRVRLPSRGLTWATVAVIVAIGFLARTMSVDLPVDGAAARVASLGDRLASEQGGVPSADRPVVPVLVAIAIEMGASPTGALRWIDAICGILIGLLTMAVLFRVGAHAATARWTGLLTALHPAVLWHVGGAAPGTAGVGVVWLLLVLWLLAHGAVARRGGAVLSWVLPYVHAGVAPYAPLLFLFFLLHEPRRRVGWALAAIGAVLHILAFRALLLHGESAAQWGMATVLWLLMAAAYVFTPAIPSGASRRWRGDEQGLTRAWIVGGGLHVALLAAAGWLHFDWEPGRASGIALVPLLLAAGLTGVRRLRWEWLRLMPRAVAVVFVVLAFVPEGSRLFGLDADRNTHLRWSRDVMTTARAAVGDSAWIVLDVHHDEPALQCSMADVIPSARVWTLRRYPSERTADDLRRLFTFPAGQYPAGKPFALVAAAPRKGEASKISEIATLEGAGIFRQELVTRVGRYLVLRMQSND